MVEWITQLESLTESVMSQLEHMEIEDFEQYVEQREVIINHIKAANPESNREKYASRVKQLLSQDDIILGYMNRKLDEAKNGLNKMRTAKTQRNVYESSYSGDSYFFDRKK